MKRFAIITVFFSVSLALFSNEKSYIITFENVNNKEISALKGYLREVLTNDQYNVKELDEYESDLLKDNLELKTKLSESKGTQSNHINVVETVKESLTPVGFIKEYYKNIKNQPLGDSYKLLSDKYASKVDGKKNYIIWWTSIESVEVVDVELIEDGISTSSVRTIIHYVFKDGRTSFEEYKFDLIYNDKIESWAFNNSMILDQF